jgi:hypothetical protein
VEAKAQAVLAARAVYLADGARLCEPQHSVKPVSSKTSQRVSPSEAAAGHRPALPKLCTLADLYDPLSMPPELVQAHAELDRAVEKCYRPEPFHSDRERVEYLFSLYEKLTAPLLPATPKSKGRRSQTAAITKPVGKAKTPALYKLPDVDGECH